MCTSNLHFKLPDVNFNPPTLPQLPTPHHHHRSSLYFNEIFPPSRISIFLTGNVFQVFLFICLLFALIFSFNPPPNRYRIWQHLKWFICISFSFRAEKTSHHFLFFFASFLVCLWWNLRPHKKILKKSTAKSFVFWECFECFLFSSSKWCQVVFLIFPPSS